MFVENENSGIVFFNDKDGNEKRPDLSGNINVEGNQFRISLWLKQGKNGEFYSVAIQESTDEPQQFATAKGGQSSGKKTFTKPTRR